MLLMAAEVQLVQIGLGALSAAGGTGQRKAKKKLSFMDYFCHQSTAGPDWRKLDASV
jgi:hypothetical protein